MDTTDNQPKSLEDFAESLLMPTQEEGQDEEPEAPDEDQTEGEAAEADEDTEASDDAEESETDDEDSEDEGEEQPDVITVKVDGEDQQVTLDDLKRSYSGQGYIQKQMQEVASHKKEVESVYQQLAQERAQVAQFVQQLQNGGAPQPPKMPDRELAQKDPQAFNREMGEYLVRKQEWDQFQSQAQQHTQAHTEAQQRAMQAHLADQARQLQAAIPEFSDPEKAKEVRGKLLNAGQEYGFSQDELAAITDARAVQVLNDARQWRELQASKGKVTKEAKPRKVMKPGARKGDNAKQQREAKRKRLQQTGRIDDAVDLLFE